MKRLLTLLAMMVMGAVAVRTQQPLLTNGLFNGRAWRESSPLTRAAYAIGATNGWAGGYIYGTRTMQLSKGCETAAFPKWVQRDATSAEIVKEMDAFYGDGANISIPLTDAFQYSLMKASGASKQLR